MDFLLMSQGAWLWARQRVRFRSERGASAVEYGVLAALIAAVIIAAVFLLGQTTSQKFDCTKNTMVTKTSQC
jgi:pilus assembly protein Flp/PilA